MEKQTFYGLRPSERAHLKKLIRRGAAPARIQTKARILLLSDLARGHHLTDGEIAALADCYHTTVSQTRQRFFEGGVQGALYGRPRRGPGVKLDADGEARLLHLAHSKPPRGKPHWTLQSLADELVASGTVESYSAVAVHKRLKKMKSSHVP